MYVIPLTHKNHHNLTYVGEAGSTNGSVYFVNANDDDMLAIARMTISPMDITNTALIDAWSWSGDSRLPRFVMEFPNVIKHAPNQIPYYFSRHPDDSVFFANLIMDACVDRARDSSPLMALARTNPFVLHLMLERRFIEWSDVVSFAHKTIDATTNESFIDRLTDTIMASEYRFEMISKVIDIIETPYTRDLVNASFSKDEITELLNCGLQHWTEVTKYEYN